MAINRIDRLNSLLKEVISDVIRLEVKHPHVSELITITRVSITKDLKYAKVFVSVIGNEKMKTIDALNKSAGFIAIQSSKQVRMRHFPQLTFYLDEGVEKHAQIEEILDTIHEEEQARKNLP